MPTPTALDFVLVGGAAFLTVLVLTPVVGWVARRLGAVVAPAERRVHRVATPTLGGVAIFAGVLAAIAAASQRAGFDAVFATTTEPEALVLAGFLIVVVGVRDDLREISAPAKVAGQILASGLLVLFGVVLHYVWWPGLGIFSLSLDWGAILTIGLLVAMMNAVNLIDGLDGLAAGVVTIAAAALLAYSLLLGGDAPPTAPLVLIAVIGACIGFLLHNFNPASIFMGDTGAMLLGLLLGAAGVLSVGEVRTPTGGTFAAASIPVLVPVLVLAVPFIDTVWTILRRLLSGKAVFSPDKQHLHHRLLELGHSHRRAVLILYYWSGLLAFAAVGASVLDPQVLLGLLAAGAGLGLVVVLTSRGRRQARQLRVR